MALTLKTAGSLVSSAAVANKGLTMEIKILRDTVAGKQPVFAGDMLEVDDMEARLLINIGKAADVRLLPEESADEPAEVKKETSKDLDSTSIEKPKKNAEGGSRKSGGKK